MTNETSLFSRIHPARITRTKFVTKFAAVKFVGVKFVILALALNIATAPLDHAAYAAGPPDSFAPLVEKVRGAVVNISATGNVPNSELDDDTQANPFPPGSPFDDFFKGMRPPAGSGPRKATSLGSGFIIDSAGIIVTNNHVIENGTDIKVTLQDGTILNATILGRDKRTDLAVLKVKSDKKLPAVELGDSDKVRVGDWIIAVGNPYALGGTVTAGIVSARSRDIQAGPYDDFLQIDAPINRGNSGGPTFNTDGQVIGVNTAILSNSGGGSIGIGFAIPSNLVKTVANQLRQAGKVKRGYLGVQIQAVTQEMADAMKLKNTQGALVAAVTPKEPADVAGVKSGDVIVNFNGKTVVSQHDLPRLVADTPVGTVARLGVIRNGQPLDLSVTVGELKEETKMAASDESNSKDDEAASSQLGLKVASLSEALRKRFDIPDTVKSGVVITAVSRQSRAAELGISAGDVIERGGSDMIKSPADFADVIKRTRASGAKAIALLINSKGQTHYVALPFNSGN